MTHFNFKQTFKLVLYLMKQTFYPYYTEASSHYDKKRQFTTYTFYQLYNKNRHSTDFKHFPTFQKIRQVLQLHYLRLG